MLHELVLAANVDKLTKAKLGNNGTELSRCSRNTVCCRTVTCGESFTGNDEGGCVGTKVLEEVGEAVEEDERVGASLGCNKFVVGETYRGVSGHVELQ